MPQSELLYLSRADVEAAGVDMTTVARLVEDGFREKGAGRVEMPPKPGIHPGGTRILPARGRAAPIRIASPPGSNWGIGRVVTSTAIGTSPRTQVTVTVPRQGM
jgi:hypothetical protein